MSMPPRQLFIAGATGATGRTVTRLLLERGVPCVPHVRPKSAGSELVRDWPRKAVVELSATEALTEAMRGCTTVLQLIGTMRKRFDTGDTYETSDIGTTRHLVEAAKLAGVDHVVLLSAMGAGRPVGAYLKAKAEAERLVRDSGLAYTVLRPPAFEGEYHRPIPGLRTLTRLPLLRGFRPIRLEELATALLRVAERRAPLNTVLEGDSLWSEVESVAA
jgi:uncharacterized protein YbjT (DUF2867 family)